MTTKEKISKEVALNEFHRFTDAMDLDVDVEGMDEEDLGNLKKNQAIMVRAICRGSLHVNEAGEPVFQPDRGGDSEALTFHEPQGGDLMAMDKRKKSEETARLYTVMAAMTRQPPKVFAAMAYGDLKVCLAIVTLFLG